MSFRIAFKRKLVPQTMREELEIINEFEKGNVISVLGNEHGVVRSTVFEIIKN